ncbi:MAG: VIT domain-containing protein [Planctomycetota bacterium]|jgi:Ca-activated chloride channel family protein
MPRTRRVVCLALLLGLVLPCVASAKTRPAPVLVLTHVKVDVSIDGPLVTTEIEQTWKNPGSTPQQVDVMLPVPPGAAVTEYEMTVAGEALPARLLPVEEARRTYLETVRRLQDPALLKHAGDEAIRARAFPVPPGEERTLSLRYQQLSSYTDGILRHAIVPATDRPEHDRIGLLEVSVSVRAPDPLVSIYSPTHALDVQRLDGHAAHAVHRAERARPGDELLLFIATSPREVGLSLLTHRAPGEDGYFLVLGAPAATPEAETRAPRTVLFVFDRSGSMKGEKIEQVQGALKFCLHSLEPADRFNLITFNNEIVTVFEEPRAAEPEAVREALRAAEALTADKGTNILDAMMTALDQIPLTGATDVVFLTDGLPTVGERNIDKILDAVKARNEGRARLFTFGVGNDVNITFLDKLALQARGFPTAVRPQEDVEVAVSSFFKAITSPALTDISLSAEGVTLTGMYPKDLPDLFRGSTLTVMGRYRGEGEANVVLEGRRGDETLAFPFTFTFPATDPGADFLPALWATRRIGQLIDDVRAQGPEAELVDEVVALARRHGIVTEYTAFLMDLDTDDPEEIRRQAAEAFERAGTVHQGAWAQSQARNKEDMKRARDSRSTTGYEDEQGRYVDLSDRVARIGSTVFIRTQDGHWVDTSVPAEAEVLTLREDSEAWQQMIASSDDVARIAALGAPITFRWDGQVVRVE